jgi:hypothetical protein
VNRVFREHANGHPAFILSACYLSVILVGNFGRLSVFLADLRDRLRLSDLNHERHWLPRLPSTLGWLHGEMFDIEEALRLNREGSAIARETKFPKATRTGRSTWPSIIFV